jgi:transposase
MLNGSMPARTPYAKREAIVSTIVETNNASEAARRYGVSSTTAQRIAKAAGVKLRKGPHVPTPKISDELRQAILETLRQEPNIGRAAKLHGVSLPTIRRAAKTAGIDLPNKPGRPRKLSRTLEKHPLKT